MSIPLLFILIVLSAFLHLFAEYKGNRKLIYVFKPLTVLLISLIAVDGLVINGGAYPVLILSGLFFSLWGDIFMMMVPKKFTEGLISFLIAHIFYIAAFFLISGGGFTLYLAMFYFIYAAGMYYYLSPGLGKYRKPVLMYIIIITVMAWQAGEILLGRRGPESLMTSGSSLIFFGALFFIASDSALAVNRFRYSFPHSQSVIMITYYLAQLLIAFSTHF